jgi:putative tryptophan/tyrosine transport system substrate-binding protein
VSLPSLPRGLADRRGASPSATVHLGLIASEARPGGNDTGIEPYVAGLPAKQMEVAREVMPSARTVGLLTNLKDPKAPPQFKDLEATAHSLNLRIVSADANRPDEIESALQALAEQKVDVVIVLQTSMLISQNRQIAESVLAKRLPAVFGYREYVEAGGLISYGVDLRWCFKRAASLVNKILHGSAPGDLPVEFPTSVMLSINLRTASKLGMSLPAERVARADEIIE